MKKFFIILAIVALAFNATAQDFYSVGYYNANEGTRAALYKNSDRLYTANNPNQNSKATRVACTSQGDVFWLVNYYDDSSNTFSHSEIRLEDMVYASTENHGNIHISDLYCLNNTVYYAGYQYNEDSVMVATVWKGSDFTEHWILGDGVHPSCINDVDMDKRTGIPYFCGYVINDKKMTAVWERQELLSIFDQDSIYEEPITLSFATQIAVEDGHYYTMGQFEQQGFPIPAIWKDNTLLTYTQPYFTDFHGICAFENTYYYGYSSRDQLYTSVLKSDQSEMLRLNSIGKMLSTTANIYVLGENFDSHFCVWKNFEELFQIENCDALYDIAVFETSINPNDYYGFLYQPINATITLDPNSSMGSEYGDFQARFEYYPNGLLDMQRAISIHPYDDESCDYDHTYWFNYDSDFHVIQQYDTYYGDWGAAPYRNYYVYDNGLLMAFSRYYNDYHADNAMILEDSISYAYDGLRRLQKEERFVSTTSTKNYEYLENVVVITTEGYSSEVWMTLTQETRTFSEDSILLSIQTEKYNDSATLVTYGYDEQGHRVSALTQKRNNGVWENQKLVQYYFNPIGRLTLAEIQLWQENEWINANRALYELDEMGYPAVVTFEKWDGEEWVNGVWQNDFYLYNEDHLKQQNDMLYSYRENINKIELSYTTTDNPREPFLPENSEWFYEIENEDGTITFQHLECAADTTINNERPTVIVRSNTQYDRDSIYTEVTHEYVYEKNRKVYWWNKDLQEFTMLYDLDAEVGDEWKIYVKYDSITMHVDAVENIVYEGRTYKMLHMSNENGFFSGDIVCGIGHLTSFFPERLMGPDKGYRVEGLRCYWIEDELVFKYGDEDCDAIYNEWHNGVNETTEDAAFAVYPNPTDDVLFVETVCTPSLPGTTYRITNVLGQTLMTGTMTPAETRHGTSLQRVDISKLPSGMYFISVGGQTVKFVVK